MSNNSNYSLCELKKNTKENQALRASRDFKADDSVIKVSGLEIGSNKVIIIAGPCAVEGEEQIIRIAKKIKESGANILRAGIFKPRTSPYSFQGLGKRGLEYLKKAKTITNMPIITEVMSPKQIELVQEDVDILQIGSRNMQNFDLLKEVGKSKKAVLLKRGLCSTIEELIMSAEYILSEGNSNVILCERGIRTFESYTRNTLDLSAVLAIKRISHLPIIVDPSHASGKRWMIEDLSKAAVAIGAHGIMVEVHDEPEKAKSDGNQSILPETFNQLVKSVDTIFKANNSIV